MVVDERLVMLGLEAETAEEALRTMADKFVELRKVKSTFPDAVIEREKIYPTGLECKPVNAAVPHCSTEYVISDALGIAVLKKPIDFALMGSPERPLPVQILVMLAVVDPAEQVPTLVQVMEFLDNEERVRSILEAKMPADVVAAVGSELS